MKKVLITGGSGFIGFHLAKKCMKLNLEVTSISRNNPPKRRRLKKVQYIKCDLTKKSEVKNKLKKQYDYIFNLSGTVNHNNKKKTFLSHYQVVENLTKRYQNSPPKMFVQLSSSAEYGGISKPPEETLNCKPKSFYGRAKFKSTKYLINLFKKNSFPVVIFRLYQAYGPYQDTNRFPSGPWCQEGDWVVFRPYSGTRMKIYGKEFRLINDDTVEAVVEDPTGVVRA